jgi:bacteriophage N4 adsorption protein B
VLEWQRLALLDEHVAAAAAALFVPIACYILVSGLDDVVADLAWVFRGRMQTRPPAPAHGASIALFIPCWREADVIADMLEHNLAAIAWPDYQVFVGVYPNDAPTLEAVRGIRHSRVHIAMTPHDGPTSKPDCLNWIYQRMLVWEEQKGVRFDVILVHDAEDVIHPDSFSRLAGACSGAAMAQIAVLPLPTPWHEMTHGIYCDDFAESQGKDLITRNALGAFVPGCGVGTAFRRDALEQLAGAEDNLIFQPGALTEDYDIGLRLYRHGFRQRFIPLELLHGAPVATREYFPRRAAASIRQRTRWVTGNSLQAWERHGWPGGWVNRWYLWRDRKGLWGNPISLLCNLLLVYGVLTWAGYTLAGESWPLLRHMRDWPFTTSLMAATTVLFAARLAFRMRASARVYGWRFASGAPLRMFWGNWINSRATLAALWDYFAARLAGRPLGWVKTDHAYPSRGALLNHKRRLGDVLVEQGFCPRSAVERAAATGPAGLRLGERLIAAGALSEDELYEALSVQQSLPTVRLEPGQVRPALLRTLPARLQREFELLPFHVQHGALYLAGPRIPGDTVLDQVRRFTRLEPRFHLITPSNFRAVRLHTTGVAGAR